jgi:serine protease Do
LKLYRVSEELALEREELAETLAALTVEVRTGRGGGSGVLSAQHGVVITCSHVLGGEGASVVLDGGREMSARVAARDNHADLALLAIAPAAGPPLELRREPLRVGELLFAMGNPFGERGVLTSGVVLALPGDGLVHADLRVAPGNSGGPLVDARGRLVGVVSMYRGGAAGAVPVSRIETLAAGLRLDSAA